MTTVSPVSPAAAPPNFNHLAGIYRWMEWLSFGPWLSRCRRMFLARLTGCHRALIFGDGDGRFTASLLHINSTVEIDAVDASPAMLEALRHRAGPHLRRVHTHIADARRWNPPMENQYDLVVTHFFLDCLTSDEVRRLAGVLRPALAPGALWIVSEFAIPGSRFGRLVAAPLVSALYAAFRIMTGLCVRQLPDYAQALREADFSLQETRTFLRGLLVSEAWVSMLRHNPV